MKKHEIIINMINDTIAFWLGHCTNIENFFFIILDQTTLLIEIMPIKTI